jgi:hypothetical protein
MELILGGRHKDLHFVGLNIPVLAFQTFVDQVAD